MKAMPLYLDAEAVIDLEKSTGSLHMGEKTEEQRDIVLDMENGDALHFNYMFSQYTELIGGSKLKLWLECLDSDDTAVFVRYYKIDRNGERVTTDFGWDDRQLHLHQHLLKPGETVPLEICIWPTARIFEAGETLQLEATGKEQPDHEIYICIRFF